MGNDLDNVDLGDLEERFGSQSQSQGFAEGLEQGRRAGLDEGYSQGFNEGSKIGSELGLYRGHLMAWIQMLQLDSDRSPRSVKLISKLGETLNLIDDFPKTNSAICEHELSDIRSRLKQITSIYGLTICDSSSQ